MVGNPTRWRAVVPQLENRNSTAGCLLALLFFLPILSKAFHISVSVVVLFTVIYVSIIVPIGTGIISRKYVINRIKKFYVLVLDNKQWKYYMTQLSYASSWIRYIYLEVKGVQTYVIQAIFCIASERLLCSKPGFSCLYALISYSFLAYVQGSLKNRPWARLYGERSPTDLIRLTTTFVLLRLEKGIVVGLVLLALSCQFKHFEPTYSFLLITFAYFCLTEHFNYLKNTLANWSTRFELQCFEGLEEHWVPFLIHLFTIAMSMSVFVGLLVSAKSYLIAVLLIYFNVWLPLKYFLQPSWDVLISQRAVILKYPLASWNNSEIRGGYPCAVCLDTMRFLTSRRTPCGHVFHSSCLRKCLQHSKQCPLCKATL